MYRTASERGDSQNRVSSVFQVVVSADAARVPIALAAGTDRIYLIDNFRKKGIRYDDVDVRSTAADITLDPNGDYWDATVTSTHLVVLDKEGGSNRLRFYLLSTGAEDGMIDLDAGRQRGEPAGDWRGVAYNRVDSLLYVMNIYGVIRTYTASRTQNTSMSVDLDLCADWQAIDFLIENTLATFLTLAKGLPVALAWDLSQPESGPARFPQKDGLLSDTDLNWVGMAVDASGDLLACRENALVFFKL